MKQTPLYHNFSEGAIQKVSDADLLDSGYQQSATVSTTNNTVTTLTSITLANDCYGYMKAYIIGIKTDGTKGITGGRFVHFKCVGAAASALSVVNNPADNLNGFTTATWAIDASGQTLRVRVTGETGNDIYWRVMYELIQIELTL